MNIAVLHQNYMVVELSPFSTNTIKIYESIMILFVFQIDFDH